MLLHGETTVFNHADIDPNASDKHPEVACAGSDCIAIGLPIMSYLKRVSSTA